MDNATICQEEDRRDWDFLIREAKVRLVDAADAEEGGQLRAAGDADEAPPVGAESRLLPGRRPRPREGELLALDQVPEGRRAVPGRQQDARDLGGGVELGAEEEVDELRCQQHQRQRDGQRGEYGEP